MYALFESLSEYHEKLNEVNDALGYPDGFGTDRYATETPQPTIDGKYPMPITERIAHLFEGCEIVESVEYEETEND
jgi:hypothetical protein